MIQEVPLKFQCKHPIKYPEDNDIEFERWFLENWHTQDSRDRVYLPILWTGYFCRHKYGRDRGAIHALQRFINSLDKNKQYYTIVQFDLGPVVKLPKNIKVLAMSGPVRHHPLPLICQPHKFTFNEPRTIFANFIGGVTHPVRKRMIDELKGKDGYLISSSKHSLNEFCRILATSIFTLCPRGFGETSFRIQEALQYGSIPVYISDTHIIPNDHEFNYGVLIHSKDVDKIDDILRYVISERDIQKLQDNGREAYNKMFTYEGCKKLILDSV